MQHKDMLCIWLSIKYVRVWGEAGKARGLAADIERPNETTYLAMHPDKDDSRAVESRLRILVGIFYKIEVHVYKYHDA